MQLSASPELGSRGSLLLGVSQPGRVRRSDVRRSNVRIVAKLASGTRSEKEVVTTTTLPNSQRVMLNRLVQSNNAMSMSSGAMEELELERGVCNPFRKYTPDRVSAHNWKNQ